MDLQRNGFYWHPAWIPVCEANGSLKSGPTAACRVPNENNRALGLPTELISLPRSSSKQSPPSSTQRIPPCCFLSPRPAQAEWVLCAGSEHPATSRAFPFSTLLALAVNPRARISCDWKWAHAASCHLPGHHTHPTRRRKQYPQASSNMRAITPLATAIGSLAQALDHDAASVRCYPVP